MKKVIIILIVVFVILAGIGGATFYYISMMNPTSETSQEVTVNIPTGSTASSIGTILAQNDLIKSEFVFKIYTKLNNVTNLKAGEYELNKNMGVTQIVEALEKGPDASKKTINVTFLEGKNMRWIAKKIAETTNNTEEKVFEKLKDTEYIDKLIEKYWFITDEIKNKNIYYPLEGYLFPDTYNLKSKDITVEEIFEVMINQMEKKLEPYKSEIQSSNIAVHRLLTMASVIELEAANKEDRAGVASVFYNRIKNNMSLGSDVTTYYAIRVDVSERDLRQSELNTYNPYNTRGPNMEGKLPIGPISSVGIDTIKSALYPEETNNLYFVADKTGKVYFGKTVEEHNANISRLQSQGLWYNYD